MKSQCIVILLLFCTSSAIVAQEKILVITGGHDFEGKEFFEMFDSFDGMSYDWIVQPKANELIQNDKIDLYDALVFYDMYQEITDAQKAAYLHALSKGTGMVFLHHSLVSYQDWPEFQQIIGGKYLLKESDGLPKSTYKHDVKLNVEIVAPKNTNHPITKGIESFQIQDEAYGDFIVNENVNPLIKTNHPESTEIIGWHHQYANSRIVYLQLGHDHHAFENKKYRLLLQRAILWVKSNT